MWHYLLFLALQCVGSAYAIGWGGKPERHVGVALLSAYALSIQFRSYGVASYLSLQTVDMAIDLTLTCALLTITWRADRRWPSLMAAMSIMTLLGHGARVLELNLNPAVYKLLIVAWAYPMIFLLIAATCRHQGRIAATGPEADWKQTPSRSWRCDAALLAKE